MDNIAEFLCSMYKKGMDLWIEGGQLCYRGPRSVLTQKDIAVLRERKSEITNILSGSGSLASILRGPVSRNSSEPAPLSIQQEGSWNGRNHFNLVPYVALRISGLLNIEIFRKSLTTVVQRHESLRTKVVLIDGTLSQQVDNLEEYELDVTDFSGGPRTEAEAEARRIVEGFLGRNLNPELDPLFQVRLLRIAKHEHVLAIAIHHLIIDGASFALLLQELWTLYDDLVLRRQSSLPKVPLQYSDYAVWQRKTHHFWLQKNGEYWNQVVSKLTRINFPVDDDLKDIERYTAGALQFSLDGTLSSALLQLARNERTTPAMILLSAFVAILSRWCKQQDLALATIFTGHDSPPLNNVMGFLTRPFLFCVSLSGQDTFLDVLRTVSQEILEAWKHLESGMVMQEPREAADTGPGALFQWLPWGSSLSRATHGLDKKDNSSANLLTVEPFPAKVPAGFYGKAGAALQMNLFNNTRGICASGYYRADLFKLSTIQKFLQSFRRFCELIVLDPKLRITSFDTD